MSQSPCCVMRHTGLFVVVTRLSCTMAKKSKKRIDLCNIMEPPIFTFRAAYSYDVLSISTDEPHSFNAPQSLVQEKRKAFITTPTRPRPILSAFYRIIANFPTQPRFFTPSQRLSATSWSCTTPIVAPIVSRKRPLAFSNKL